MNDETTDTLTEAEAKAEPERKADIDPPAQRKSVGGFRDDPFDPSSESVEDKTDVEDDDDEDDDNFEGSKSIRGDGQEYAKPSSSEEVKRPGAPKRVLEYDLADMYPQVSALVGKPRREWNFHDPEVIRAMWLDSKTNAITDWKIRFAKLNKARRTEVEIPLNHTAQLRLDFRKQKEEEKKVEFGKTEDILYSSKSTPHFNTVQMATTTTVEMRYKFTRNNPPVPAYYINHYDKYKRPPFKTKVGRPCKMTYHEPLEKR